MEINSSPIATSPRNSDDSPKTAEHSPKTAENENSQNDESNEAAIVAGENEAIPVSDDEEAEIPVDTYFEEAPQVPVEELDEISIAKEISSYMQVNRVNVGELDNLEDMWGICDAISAAHSGLPDSLLKEAFNLVLEGYYGHSLKNAWMRKHLDHLLRMWKKEMLNEKSSHRPTKFVSSSVEYFPPNHQMSAAGDEQTKIENVAEMTTTGQNAEIGTQKEGETSTSVEAITAPTQESMAKQRRQRRLAAKRKRELAAIMGVGQMLEHARRKFATEDGELDIDEDEYGNFKIGGVELNFENWGQLNKIKADGIVHLTDALPAKRFKRQRNGMSAAHQAAKQLSANAPQPPKFGTPSSQTAASMSNQISMAEQYPTVGEVEMPGEPTMPKGGKTGKLEKKALPPPKPAKKEKDEGEISSSESDKPTSSSSSEDEESEGGIGSKRKMVKKSLMKSNKQQPMAQQQQQQIRAQDRRKIRREEERQQGPASAQNLQMLLRKCYDLRYRIVGKLSIQQKALFMDLMKASMSGTLQQNAQQQDQALTHLMGTFQH